MASLRSLEEIRSVPAQYGNRSNQVGDIHINIVGAIFGADFDYWSGIQMVRPNAVDNNTSPPDKRVEYFAIKLISDYLICERCQSVSK
jgi:hypothetical protein